MSFDIVIILPTIVVDKIEGLTKRSGLQAETTTMARNPLKTASTSTKFPEPSILAFLNDVQRCRECSGKFVISMALDIQGAISEKLNEISSI